MELSAAKQRGKNGRSETGQRFAGVVTPLSLFVYLDLAFLLFRQAWLAPPSGRWLQHLTWVGGCCDPEQTMWFLRWTPFALLHQHNPLFTDYLNFPGGVNMMWNNFSPLAGLLLSPLTLAFGPVVAYNAFLTLAVGLSAWCAYLALRRFTRGPLGAFVGGAVYGFSPYVVSQAMQHAHVTLVAIPPLLLLLFDEVVVRRRRPAWAMGICLGLLAVAQLLLAEELLFTEVLTGTLLLLTLVGTYRRAVLRHIPRLVRVAVWASPTFGLLAAWPLYSQFRGPQRLSGHIHQANSYATDLLNFVVPTEAQALAPSQALALAGRFSGLEHEANAYLGFPLLLLLAFIVGRLWARPIVRVSAWVGVAVALLSLGTHIVIGGQTTTIPLPWNLVARLPLLDDVLTNRLTVYMYLAVGLLLAVYIDTLTAPGRRRWGALLVTALVLVPLVPRLDFPASSHDVPTFFFAWSQAGIPNGSVVLVAPRATDGGGADQMLWQAEAGDHFRMPDGYVIIPGTKGHVLYNAPPASIFKAMDTIEQTGAIPPLTPSLRRSIKQDLRARAIAAVVVGPMQHRAETVRFFTALFGRSPDEEGDVELWRHVQQHGVRVRG